MNSIKAFYNCESFDNVLDGSFVRNTSESIRVVYQDGAHQMAEQIIPLYEQYGVDCVKYLQGALSFCLYDANKKQLLVVRDRIGKTQLYYSQLPTGIVFGSNLSDVLQHVKHPQLRAHELAQPIRHNYPIDLQHTWIEQIKRLRAGEYSFCGVVIVGISCLTVFCCSML